MTQLRDPIAEGAQHYIRCDTSIAEWFRKQWEIWPERADDNLTTNGSYHYGAILSYREGCEGRDPPMSPELTSFVRVMDRLHNMSRS